MRSPSIGQALRQLRVERGQTLSELEQRTGIGRGYLLVRRAREAPHPALTVVAKVAQALELDQEAQFLLGFLSPCKIASNPTAPSIAVYAPPSRVSVTPTAIRMRASGCQRRFSASSRASAISTRRRTY